MNQVAALLIGVFATSASINVIILLNHLGFGRRGSILAFGLPGLVLEFWRTSRFNLVSS